MQTPAIRKWHNLLTGNMAQKGYLSVVDQAVVSGSNFLTGVLLGRYVLPEEYGIFVIAWTTLVIALSLQNALICTPMSVIGAQKTGVESDTYWGSLLIGQLLFGGVICVSFLIAGLIMQGTSIIPLSMPSFVALIMVMFFACFFFLCQEFFRRLLIFRLNLRETLLNDVITNTIRLGGLTTLLYAGLLNTVHSLLVIAIAFFIGTALGYRSLKDIILISWAKLRSNLLESWYFGKWVLAEMLPSIITAQGYTYLTALFVGAKETGALFAAQNVLNVTNIFILSFTNFITPIAAQRYEAGGNKALNKLIMGVGLLSAIPIIGFYLLMMAFAEEILVFVYRENYAGYGMLLIACSVYFIFSYFNRILQIVLYAKRKPDIGFRAKAASLVVMALCAYPLLKYYGVYGAAAGTAISQIVILSGLLNYLMRRDTNENHG